MNIAKFYPIFKKCEHDAIKTSEHDPYVYIKKAIWNKSYRKYS